MGLEKVSHVVTGFGGWRDDGLPVVDYETWNSARQ